MPAVYGIKESKMLQKKKKKYIYIYIYIYIFIYNSAHRITIHWNTTHKVTVIYELCVLLLKFAY